MGLVYISQNIDTVLVSKGDTLGRMTYVIV